MTNVAVLHLPSVDGHFLEYGRCFAEAAHKRYERVFVLIPQTRLAESGPAINWPGVEVRGYAPGYAVAPSAPLLMRQLSDWIGLRRACSGLGFNAFDLVLTFIDAVFMPCAVLPPPRGARRLIAMSMRADIGQHDTRGRCGDRSGARGSLARRVKHGLWRRFLRSGRLAILGTNDPCFQTKALEEGLIDSARLPLLTDYSACRPPDQRPDRTDRVITCLAIGYLDRRKCLSLLVQGISSYRRSHGPDVRLLLAGERSGDVFDPAGQVAFDGLRAEGAVTVLEGRLSDEAYCEAFARADAVWAVYDGHVFASGVALDTIAAQRLLLAQADGVIGYYAAGYPSAVRLPCDPGVEDVVDALVRMRGQFESALAAPASASATVTVDVPDRGRYVDHLVTRLFTALPGAAS